MRFAWYRRWLRFTGSRTFVRPSVRGDTYASIKGNAPSLFVQMVRDGWKEDA